MKKINKILGLIGIAAIPALSIIPMVSCGDPETGATITPFEKRTYIIGDAASEIAYFTYSGTIGDDQRVVISSSSEYFKFGTTTIYTNNVIACPISRITGSSERKQEILDLTFKCLNANGSQAWEYVLKEYRIVYSPGVFITEDQKNVSTEYDFNTDTCYYTYNLTLESAVDDYTMKPEIKNAEGDAEVSILSYSNSGKTMTVTVELDGVAGTTLQEGKSQAKFDMLFSCIDEHQQTMYTPLTISGFTLTYMAGSKAIPEANFTWGETADGKPLLTAVDCETGGPYNTLHLPDRHNGSVYEVDEGVFYDESTQTTKLPDSIKSLKIGDITAITLPDNCFNKAPIKILNLSEQIKSHATSFDEITVGTGKQFGANSFAFADAGAMGSGTIFYNDVFEDSDRVTLQTKLWYAGIKGPNWYGVTEVSTEKELKQAAWVGGNINLTANITLTSPLDFNSTNSYLNLNGWTLTADRTFYKDDEVTPTGLVRLFNSQVIIYDSESYDQSAINKGTIKPYQEENPEDGSMAIEILPSGSGYSALTIYGGTYYGNQKCIYNNGASVFIKSIFQEDGTETYVPKFKLFKDKTPGKWMFDCDDDSVKDGISSFKFSGGWFYYTYKQVASQYYYRPSHADADTIDGVPSNWLNEAGGFEAINDTENYIIKVQKSS